MTKILSGTRRLAALVLAPALLLGACGSDDDDLLQSDEGDAMESSALGDQIMIDPDLAGENQAGSAVSADLRDGILPPEMKSSTAIAKARGDALNLVGGPSSLKKAPNATGDSAASASLAAAAKSAASPGGSGDCAADATYSAKWAADMPETFPIYPQGAVQDSAGNDDGACSLRVVTFLSAVPLGEVLDFYYTRATDAGFSAEHAKDEEGYDVLGGKRGSAAYIVYGRTLPTSNTEITLVTGGE